MLCCQHFNDDVVSLLKWYVVILPSPSCCYATTELSSPATMFPTLWSPYTSCLFCYLGLHRCYVILHIVSMRWFSLAIFFYILLSELLSCLFVLPLLVYQPPSPLRCRHMIYILPCSFMQLHSLCNYCFAPFDSTMLLVIMCKYFHVPLILP